MNPSKSKIRTLCEKHAKECNFDNSTPNDASVCSCSHCNSFDCFALRNKGQCLCYQSSQQPTQPFSESNKNFTNTSESKSSVNAFKLPGTESVLKERVKKEIVYEYNNNDNLTTVKKVSRYSYNCVPEFNDRENRVDISTERLAHSRSATMTYSRQNFDTNTAKLSAQIMNVPYKDFKESISYNKSEDSAPKQTKLSRYDILQRIKEAYRACSCKVCECLIGNTTTRSGFCKCKPCECNECLSLMKNFDNKDKIKQAFIGCPCIRCDRRKECKGVVKNGPRPYCDCDPCDCLKCSDSFTKPCNCQPCECIECRSYSISKPRKNNTVVVASIREDVPLTFCECSPCDCADCGHDFTISSSLRREIGTGINRPVNCSCDACMNQACETPESNSCPCDTQKQLMRKPVEKDVRDYDIHRASVKKNVAERSQNQNDTIAMFAAVGNSFQKRDIKNNSCSCGDCECIVCSCKENTTRSVNNKSLKYHETGACKCYPCECLICNSSTVKDVDFLDRKKFCECNICDCLKCDGLSKPCTSNDERNVNSNKFKSMIPLNACKCSPCECTDCQKIMYKCIGDSCYCANCKCEMCTDQTNFINETVYRRDRSDYLPLSFTYSNNNYDKYFLNKNDGKTCLPPKSLHPYSERNIQMKSRQDLVMCNESPNVDNPIRKSTQVLISNNPEIKEHERYQTVRASEAFTKCKDKNIEQSFCRSHEYESSQSFFSENSSLGLPSRVSNIQPNGNLDSVKEQEQPRTSAFEFQKSCDRSAHNSLLIKFPVKMDLDNFTNFGSDTKNNSNYKNACNPIRSLNATTKKSLKINYPHSDINQHDKGVNPGINGANSESIKLLGVDKRSHLIKPIRKTSEFGNNSELTGQDHEITNVKDLSLNLVTALKNANERLSTVMTPELSNFRFKLGSSKADLSLPNNTNIRKETFSIKNNENNPPFETAYPKYTDDLSDMEIDYDKVRRTLQQAKVFSLELAKVLKDYKNATKKIESKPLNETRSKISSNILLDTYLKNKTNNIEIDKSIKNNVNCENLVEGHDQEPYSSAYEPAKKYGSHNLNVMTTNQDVTETNNHQTAKIDDSIKLLPDNESVKVTYDLDDDINKNTIITTRQDVERQDSKPIHGKILINEPSSSIDKQIEDESDEHLDSQTNSYGSQKIEDSHKCRYEKTQKCTKGGKRLRVPRSVILYKRLKLKEALMNLATNSGIRQDNLTPQCIQCDDKERVINTDVTTQHEPHCSEDKREMTTTATNAMSRHEILRFVQPVQAVHGLESPSWSILKKNYLMSSPAYLNRGICLMPPLLLDVKDTLRAISRQDGEPGRSEVSNEVTVTSHGTHGNKALLQLQTEVNKLWESSMPQDESESPNRKSKLDLIVKDFKIASSQTCNLTNSVKKAVDCMDSAFSVAVLQRQLKELVDMTSMKDPAVKKSVKVLDVGNTSGGSTKSELMITKSSCDALKVKFLGLRRVSDHTVLVKWKAPRDVTSVQGYELLVDGRAVQKILSPSRCMAVVTCLPNMEKVLITIRTLVSAVPQRAHYPSATIVYRSRAKLI